jgi:pyrroline-5-carboxylate reductase
MTKLLLVGGGRMGEALIAGLLSSGWATSAEELAVCEKLPARRDELAARYPGLQVSAEPVEADSAVLAVKPPEVAVACAQLRSLGTKRVLSIAAGITLATL